MSKAIPVTVLSPAIINTVSPCSPLAAAAVVEEVRGSLTSRRRAISSQAPIVRILGDRILTRRRGQNFWRVASTGEKIVPVGFVNHINPPTRRYSTALPHEQPRLFITGTTNRFASSKRLNSSLALSILPCI